MHQEPVSQRFVRTILVYEFVEPVLNYGSNEFVALTNLCETGPCNLLLIGLPMMQSSECDCDCDTKRALSLLGSAVTSWRLASPDGQRFVSLAGLV